MVKNKSRRQSFCFYSMLFLYKSYAQISGKPLHIFVENIHGDMHKKNESIIIHGQKI